MKLSDIITPDKFRQLITFITICDEKFGLTGTEVQEDLRKFADALEEMEAKSIPSKPVLVDALSIDMIRQLRTQLPQKWLWRKCYEIPYSNSRTWREFTMKHWALTPENNHKQVCSLGLISQDHHSANYSQFAGNDIAVQWVEKSLMIVDSLLAEIDRLNSDR